MAGGGDGDVCRGEEKSKRPTTFLDCSEIVGEKGQNLQSTLKIGLTCTS